MLHTIIEFAQNIEVVIITFYRNYVYITDLFYFCTILATTYAALHYVFITAQKIWLLFCRLTGSLHYGHSSTAVYHITGNFDVFDAFQDCQKSNF